MAFISIKKNLDERARKKDFDEIFHKYDHNKNGMDNPFNFSPLKQIFSGAIYIKDFIKDMQLKDIKIETEEVEKLSRMADKSGQVMLKFHKTVKITDTILDQKG